jgi:molybdate transport system substrate-binding protein
LGKTRDAGITLARGTLSLVWRSSNDTLENSEQDPRAALSALKRNLDSAQSFKLAIPNPQHAPYGIAARQALESAGLWPLPPGYLLNAENAVQTLQFALSGAVDYAIVPDTLLVDLPSTLEKMSLEPASYEAVIHQMVLLTSAGSAAQTLYDWLQSESAKAIFTRYGLTPER